jgi:hypothetical protein
VGAAATGGLLRVPAGGDSGLICIPAVADVRWRARHVSDHVPTLCR